MGKRIRDQNVFPETSVGGVGSRESLFTYELEIKERGTKKNVQMSKPGIVISRDLELIVDTQFSAHGTDVLRTEKMIVIWR